MVRESRVSGTARKARNVCAISAGVVAVAAFLPWVNVFGISVSGIEGDGLITLACAVVGLVLTWRGKLGWVGQLVPAALVALVGLFDLNNFSAIGLYLTILAGIAWVVGAFMVRAARPEPPEPDAGEATSSGAPDPSDASPTEPVAIGDADRSAAP